MRRMHEGDGGRRAAFSNNKMSSVASPIRPGSGSGSTRCVNHLTLSKLLCWNFFPVVTGKNEKNTITQNSTSLFFVLEYHFRSVSPHGFRTFLHLEAYPPQGPHIVPNNCHVLFRTGSGHILFQETVTNVIRTQCLCQFFRRFGGGFLLRRNVPPRCPRRTESLHGIHFSTVQVKPPR